MPRARPLRWGPGPVGADIFSAMTYGTTASMRSRAFLGIGSWVMWYDFFSVPQPNSLHPRGTAADHTNLTNDLGRAVASLAGYVDACKYFMVLAPMVLHEDGHVVDYSTWMERGWCRFERLARQLSRQRGAMLLVRREDTVLEIGAQDYFMDPVGRGVFGVEMDKARLGPSVQKLVRGRLSDLYGDGRFAECRNLLAWCCSMMDGLPVDWRDAIPPPLFDRQECGLSCWLPFCGEGQRFWGLTPLLVAAGIGDVSLLRAARWSPRPRSGGKRLWSSSSPAARVARRTATATTRCTPA